MINENGNEIRHHYFIDKESLDDYFGKILTQEDMEDLDETLDNMDRDEICWWIIDYYNWTPKEEK